MPVKLVRSTEMLRRDGIVLPGLPLFDSDDRAADAIANLWVIASATEMGHLPNTTWAYARALKAFREDMEATHPNVAWYRANSSDVVRFEARMAGAGNSEATNDNDGIALKLNGLASIFDFAAAKQLIPFRPFTLSKEYSAGGSQSGPTRIRVPAGTLKRPSVITLEQLLRIRHNIDVDGEDERMVVDQTIKWGWGTAVRLGEAVAICRSKIKKAVMEKSPRTGPRDTLRDAFLATTAEAFVVELWPKWTKGGRGGTILVPRDLIKTTVDWMDLHPSAALSDGFDPVFTSRRGLPYEPATIGKYFHAAARAAKVSATFHCLRHSWATRILDIFATNGKAEMGGIFVQAQLRHRWRQTTERYLHAAEMTDVENAAWLAVAGHYGKAFRA